MEHKKINVVKLNSIIKQLKDGSKEAVGSYIFKGFRIQISEYGMSTAERVQALYTRRRKLHQCLICCKKIVRKNPRTGKLYRLCDKHRRQIDLNKKK